MTGFLFTTVVIIIFALVAFRIGPSYIEYFTVQKALDQTMVEVQNPTISDIKRSMDRRLSADYVDAVRSPRRAGRARRQHDRRDAVVAEDPAHDRQREHPARVRGALHAGLTMTVVDDDDAVAHRRSTTLSPTPSLLRQALTHRSYGVPHNERLEFIGDAVPELRRRADPSTSGFRHFPKAICLASARISSTRTRWRRSRAASGSARPSAWAKAKRGAAAPTGRRSWPMRWRRCSAPYSSTPVSTPRRRTIGAVYADLLRDVDPSTLGKDPKTRLQEWLQAQRLPVPEYAIVATTGEAPCADVRRRMPHRRACRSSRWAPAAAAARPSRTPRCRRWPRLQRRAIRARVTDEVASLRSRRDRRTAVGRQVDAAECARRCAHQHHVAQAADDAPSHLRHPAASRASSTSSSTRRASRRATHRGSTSGSTAPFARRSPTST